MKRNDAGERPFAAFTGVFDAAAARHLLRRAGIGSRPSRVADLVAAGLPSAVSMLFEPDPGPTGLARFAAHRATSDVTALAAYWIACMLRSRDGVHEKLALFWHGHFATSNDKVDEPARMLAQLEVFARLGASRFASLLEAVAVDPAMLIHLDAEKNRRGQPNENFARELFELFTLGIGHYDERDVAEAARAFTGFRRAGDRFEFVPAMHDDGEKEVLGHRGRLGPTEVLAIAARHPATARRLARALLRFYGDRDPAAVDVLAFATLLVELELDVGEALRRLFASTWFFAGARRAARIASPVEFAIGALRSLELRADASALVGELTAMGQSLLRPPTVAGWEGEAGFVSAGTMLARARFASRLAAGEDRLRLDDLPSPDDLDAANDDESLVAALETRLVAARLEPAVREAACRTLAGCRGAARVAAALRVVLSCPEASLV
jgi:uncharacterized protein (DUF1800 family)